MTRALVNGRNGLLIIKGFKNSVNLFEIILYVITASQDMFSSFGEAIFGGFHAATYQRSHFLSNYLVHG